MSTVAEIIAAAYRESNLIALGTSPSANQTTEALSRLQTIVRSVYGAEVGEPLRDWPLGTEGVVDADDNWTNERWRYPFGSARGVVQLAESDTVYLPENPDDGARFAVVDPNGLLSGALVLTVDGNGRSIGATVATANTTYAVDSANETLDLLYRADLGIWAIVSALTEGGEFPFPVDYDDYFIISLAMRLNPRYGRTMSDAQMLVMERALGQLRAQYRQHRTVALDPGLRSRAGSYGVGSGMEGGGVPRGRIGWMF